MTDVRMRRTGTAPTMAAAEIETYETLWKNWDRIKLAELGVNTDFIRKLDDGQARDLVRGLLYLFEKHKSQL
ncbi:hypothetical protein NTE_00237 [Candidatus Nitrososphaera evergladensis SR1]|uniref:Uncharacterized protein n=1 Tax=Candidatus Nitrososphaera evergladensis SR1 TaxID=1459636 RepID=A0A075MSJ5_9ARCH|nr:hypothetical protein NTE_00237 [Candidatus Nitrososphaera evergladensis SR1]